MSSKSYRKTGKSQVDYMQAEYMYIKYREQGTSTLCAESIVYVH